MAYLGNQKTKKPLNIKGFFVFVAERVSAGLELQMVSCGNTFVASTCFFATSLFHQVS